MYHHELESTTPRISDNTAESASLNLLNCANANIGKINQFQASDTASSHLPGLSLVDDSGSSNSAGDWADNAYRFHHDHRNQDNRASGTASGGDAAAANPKASALGATGDGTLANPIATPPMPVGDGAATNQTAASSYKALNAMLDISAGDILMEMSTFSNNPNAQTEAALGQQMASIGLKLLQSIDGSAGTGHCDGTNPPTDSTGTTTTTPAGGDSGSTTATGGSDTTAAPSSADNSSTAPAYTLAGAIIPSVPRDAIVVAAATGNAATDTANIQNAIDSAPAGSTVYIPGGSTPYMINTGESQGFGIHLDKGITLQMAQNTVLEAAPTSDQNGAIIQVNASNANVYGGTLDGNHAGTGEWNFGLTVSDGASNVNVVGVTSQNNHGDGFYVSDEGGTNVTFNDDVAQNNRRNDMSIVATSGLLVENSEFLNATGTSPQSGIDIEPNRGGTTKNVKVINSLFQGNAGWGLQIGMDHDGSGPNPININNTIENNTFAGNTLGGLFNEEPQQTIQNNSGQGAESVSSS